MSFAFHAFRPALYRPVLMACTLCWSLVYAPLIQAAEWNIDQLMHGLAQIKSGHVSFVETKTMAILDRPLVASGDMIYTAPDKLEKRTLKPKPETMQINGKQLLVQKGKQKHQVQLQDFPELAAFIDSIRGTLAGDRKALERNYLLSLEGSEASWTLQLIPTNSKMKQVVAQIRISGVRDEVRSISITQADGDSSRMLIEKIVPPKLAAQ
ncbi:MAG: outer membrane lipoprotein carrier protein LolA [Polaromonas sp.]|nr:outer membrane lipoprotein carrier protein LolA [Polaromonas sp.]